MLGGKPWEDWIEEYSQSHQTRGNQITHKIGIPMIAASLPLFLIAIPVSFFVRWFWILPVALFVLGWILQFVGHAIEGKPPEFFKDWRFLLVGLRWWFAKIRG
jgi:uncharacterized membrane protein YGL010W